MHNCFVRVKTFLAYSMHHPIRKKSNPIIKCNGTMNGIWYVLLTTTTVLNPFGFCLFGGSGGGALNIKCILTYQSFQLLKKHGPYHYFQQKYINNSCFILYTLVILMTQRERGRERETERQGERQRQRETETERD